VTHLVTNLRRFLCVTIVKRSVVPPTSSRPKTRAEWIHPTEAVAMTRKLEAIARGSAKDRKWQAGKEYGRGRPKIASDTVPEAISGRAGDIIGAAVGLSGTSYTRAKAVVDAAEENPEKFRPTLRSSRTIRGRCAGGA
jgi:hypothetical protein